MIGGNRTPAQEGSAEFAPAVDEDTLRQSDVQVEQAAQLSRRPESPPASVPGFTILRCLGEGAFGSVWLAEEQNTGKKVAIKFYTHRRGLDWSLLNREVEKLAVLYTSRHIVRLLDVGWDSDPPFYVMEYLQNGSLSSFLSQGPLPPQEAVRIAKSVLQALVHAHGSGILHCDLKPANVLLDADLEPRICDFGQSRLSYEQNPALGTLFYMAPEQADLNAVPDARWDVYALGALLYQMLCGEAPYRTADNERLIRSTETLEERLAVYRRMVRNSPKPNRHRKMAGVDKRLADVVDRCLKTDPQERFPNAQAVLDVLELRDRQRARRPLVVLGIVGPALLLLGMGPIVYNAMHSAVEQARHNLTDRALESDVLSARILSSSLERELADRRSEVQEIAAKPELRQAVEEYAHRPLDERTPLIDRLHEAKAAVDHTRQESNRELDTSWFLTDADGYQRWREPLNPNTIDENWAYRDYFHGRNLQYPPDAVPPDVEPIRRPHISLAFRSQATKRFMVAISVPVWDEKHERVIGVLARTTHLGQLLSEYGSRIQGRNGDQVNRVIALVDRRDWKLLDHPWMTEANLRARPPETFAKLTLDNRTVQKLSRLYDGVQNKREPPSPSPGSASSQGEGARVKQPSVAAQTDRDAEYTDPVGTLDPTAYGGQWLAAFSPVGGTGWTAIVQERRSAALKPVEQMQAGLIRYGVWAMVVSVTLIGLLWFFVLRALSDRTPRLAVDKNQSSWASDSTDVASNR